jgi:hypothetical protein
VLRGRAGGRGLDIADPPDVGVLSGAGLAGADLRDVAGRCAGPAALVGSLLAYYPATNAAFYDPNFAAGATSHWMFNYVTMVLGQAVRAGLPADGIFKWTAANLIWQNTSPDYNPWLQGEYVIPNLSG